MTGIILMCVGSVILIANPFFYFWGLEQIMDELGSGATREYAKALAANNADKWETATPLQQEAIVQHMSAALDAKNA